MRLGELSTDQIADAALLGVVAAVPLVWTPGLADAWRFGKESVLIVGAAAALALHLTRPCVRAPARSAMLAAGLFVLGLLAALPRAPALAPAGRWSLVFAAFVAVLGMVATHARPMELARRLALLLVAGGVVQAVVGLVQIGVHGSTRGKLAMLGTIGNSEQAASYLAPLLLFMLALPRSERPRGHGVLLGLLVVGLAAARSRGACLAALVGVAVMWAPLWLRHWRQVAFAISLLVLGSVLLWHWLPNDLTSLHTLRGRVLIYAIAIRTICATYGLGLGFDGFRWHVLEGQRALFESGAWDAYADNAALVARAHNELLDFAVEGGLLCAAGLVAMVALSLRQAWRRHGEASARPYASALVAMCAHAWVSFPFHVIPTLLMAAVCCGALLAPAASSSEPDPSRLRSRRWAAGVTALLVVVLGVGESVAWRGEFQHGRALDAISRGDLMAAQAALEVATSLSPKNDAAQLTQAQLYYETRELALALAVLGDLGERGHTIDVLKLQARILMDLGRWGEAIQSLTLVAQAYPNHVTPRFDLGRCHLALGRRAEARASFEQALARRAKSSKGRWEQTRARQYLDALRD